MENKILFENIDILDENLKLQQNCSVIVDKDKISKIYRGEKAKGIFSRVIDGRGKLMMPGFVNNHAHLPMSLLRGYGENMKLQDWLFKKIFPFEEHLDREAVYYGTLLSMAESLQFGITSTSDMYYFMDDIAAAILDSGAKANISRSVSHFDNSDFMSTFRAKEMIDAYEKYNNKGDGRLKVDMSLHSEYTTTPIAVIQLGEYAKSINARMQVHVSETKREVDECIQRHGVSPVVYLERHGLFDVPTTAAHCVWLFEEDYKILKEKNVTVATNPVSNMKLASGVCNVGKIIEEGINLTVGTDGAASNNNLNIIEELKVMSIGYKMKYDDTVSLKLEDILKAATINGALSQGRDDTGLIKEGYKADIILVDTDVPNMKPLHDMLGNLVYSACGSDVTMTMVDGKILYENGDFKTIDIEHVISKVEAKKKEILGKL